MPELPEVDAIRRGIAEQLLGKSIVSYRQNLPKLVTGPEGLTLESIVGRSIEQVERRGKYLALTLGDLVAVVHLKLSGQVVVVGERIPGFEAGHPVPAFGTERPHKSTHLILTFDDGSLLYLTDIRHFSRIQLMPRDDLPEFWTALGLGPDAIADAFTREWFHEAIHRRTQARLKPLLLEQSFVAGLGNIYVDESFHLAKLHPERLARDLTATEIDRLYDAIREVMRVALPIGGAKILNGKALPGPGEFPYIHGREGQPCVHCGTTIIKTKVNNRGTYLCLTCQPAP